MAKSGLMRSSLLMDQQDASKDKAECQQKICQPLENNNVSPITIIVFDLI